MGIPLGKLMKVFGRMGVQTNRQDPNKERRGRLSRITDYLGPVRWACNRIVSYEKLGVKVGDLGLNMVLVGRKVRGW